MNDFREYVGIDYTPYLMHYGVSKRDGAKIGSGRYPIGSGKNPKAKLLDPSKQSKEYAKELNKLDHQRAVAQKKVDKAKSKIERMLNRMDLEGYKVKKKTIFRTVAYGDKYLEKKYSVANLFYRLLYSKKGKVEEPGIKYKVKAPTKKSEWIS